MDQIYPQFARVDPVFYDNPALLPAGKDTLFAPTRGADWSSWSTTTDGTWTYWTPQRAVIPPQGWKLHVSATPSSAAEALERTSYFCHERRQSFKYLTSTSRLHGANSKDADRSSSGKFITIYPDDPEELESLLVELDRQLAHLPGPYVLSDLRWKNGPIYIRYGGFAKRHVEVDGVEAPAILDPTGQLVPDVRLPQFVVPDWLRVPSFIEKQRAALTSERIPADFPAITRALHHSNAGGVYEATDRDGSPVVLKEARPHAGFTPDGLDAPARLWREADTLAALSYLPGVVKIRRRFEFLDHRYLVLEQVAGRSLQEAAIDRYPLVRADPTADECHAYRDWALRVLAKLDAVLAQVHAGGHIHGDLHPRNVMVTADGDVVLLDFEMAQGIESSNATLLGAPGFVPPDQRSGLAQDDWALACIRLFLFAPLTSLINLDPRKADELSAWAMGQFDLDESWAHKVRTGLRLSDHGAPTVSIANSLRLSQGGVAGRIDDIAEALVHDVSLERLDRAWPGDPVQFAESPASLAHGAGGVLLVLNAAGVPAPEGSHEWFNRAADNLCSYEKPALGLMDGLAGVVWARKALGDEAGTARAISRLLASDMTAGGPGLYRGSAGIGLVLLENTDRADALQACHRIAENLMGSLHDLPQPGEQAATGQAGLMHGWSGAALFALRLHRLTGNEEYLSFARDALERDVAVCKRTVDGSVHVNEGWRLVPYLGTGSTGIGMVVRELAQTNPSTSRRQFLRGAQRAASASFVAYPGLLQGRAGLIHFLLDADDATDADATARLEQQVRLLSLHAIRRPRGTSYPGHGLLRLSCDLASGSAGVLTALLSYRARADRPGSTDLPPLLPFLPAPAPSDRDFSEGGENNGSSPLAPGA